MQEQERDARSLCVAASGQGSIVCTLGGRLLTLMTSCPLINTRCPHVEPA